MESSAPDAQPCDRALAAGAHLDAGDGAQEGALLALQLVGEAKPQAAVRLFGRRRDSDLWFGHAHYTRIFSPVSIYELSFHSAP